MKDAVKLLIVIVITLPLACISVIMRLSEGEIISALIFALAPTLWTLIALYMLWYYLRHDGTEYCQTVPNTRKIKIQHIMKKSCTGMIVLASFILVVQLITGGPWYMAFDSAWWIITNSSELFFVKVLTANHLYR